MRAALELGGGLGASQVVGVAYHHRDVELHEGIVSPIQTYKKRVHNHVPHESMIYSGF